MPSVRSLFETHLTVTDLDRSLAFYRDRLGLTLAAVFPEREVAFFWVGPGRGAMLGLWAAGHGPQRMTHHTAFATSLEDVLAAPAALRAAGITPLDLDERPTSEPVVLAWMPAAAVYFKDPDGNLLEYIAMLDQQPRPERGVVAWSQWTL
ncbi:MAG TPA: glyoxalase [Solibacterales bacterium]|nr:glyoxalase [Bryobacterales bacterium]